MKSIKKHRPLTLQFETPEEEILFLKKKIAYILQHANNLSRIPEELSSYIANPHDYSPVVLSFWGRLKQHRLLTPLRAFNMRYKIKPRLIRWFKVLPPSFWVQFKQHPISTPLRYLNKKLKITSILRNVFKK